MRSVPRDAKQAEHMLSKIVAAVVLVDKSDVASSGCLRSQRYADVNGCICRSCPIRAGIRLRFDYVLEYFYDTYNRDIYYFTIIESHRHKIFNWWHALNTVHATATLSPKKEIKCRCLVKGDYPIKKLTSQ